MTDIITAMENRHAVRAYDPEKKIKISAPVYTFCEVFDHIAINNFLVLLVCVIYKIDINQCIIHK